MKIYVNFIKLDSNLLDFLLNKSQIIFIVCVYFDIFIIIYNSQNYNN